MKRGGGCHGKASFPWLAGAWACVPISECRSQNLLAPAKYRFLFQYVCISHDRVSHDVSIYLLDVGTKFPHNISFHNGCFWHAPGAMAKMLSLLSCSELVRPEGGMEGCAILWACNLRGLLLQHQASRTPCLVHPAGTKPWGQRFCRGGTPVSHPALIVSSNCIDEGIVSDCIHEAISSRGELP